jgi:hypothetical protein
MRAEVLDDPRAWNLSRSRAEGVLRDLGLVPSSAGSSYGTDDGKCAGVRAAFEE